MMREIEERISKLKLSIEILKDHLKKYGHRIDPKAYDYIKNQIESYKLELQIRKDYPI
ncbi:MAG: hypothetical protein KAT66_02595 [Candidatus Lokiarchaeota archaeon]|nr:hypothetical protein [Candidatus Lokiarchaeota archaeon]